MVTESWRALSVERREGGLHGMGLFALRDIEPETILALKRGHFVDEETVIANSEIINGSHHQIERNLFLAGLTPEEVDESLIGYNHSCSPNAYPGGRLLIKAMAEIVAGDEITVDYSTIFTSDTQSFKCECRSTDCRHQVVPSQDWRNPELRKKYRGFFAPYLQEMIDAEAS